MVDICGGERDSDYVHHIRSEGDVHNNIEIVNEDH